MDKEKCAECSSIDDIRDGLCYTCRFLAKHPKLAKQVKVVKNGKIEPA